MFPYFNYRDELTVQDGFILRDDRKVKVHAGHGGINSCERRARDLISWSGMSNVSRVSVELCNTSATYCARQPEQPPLTHGVPSRPWQKVSTYIFSIIERNYLITVDYFSVFIEVDYLQDITSSTLIHKLKHHFARHGFAEVLLSDNGTQYTSEKFS